MNKEEYFHIPFAHPGANKNASMFMGVDHADGPDTTHIRTEAKPGPWAGWPGNLNPIELMMSSTAKDRLGFPTHRNIIDAEFEMA